MYDVRVSVGDLSEAFATVRAVVWLLARVDPLVVLHVLLPGEGLGAEGAGEGPLRRGALVAQDVQPKGLVVCAGVAAVGARGLYVVGHGRVLGLMC